MEMQEISKKQGIEANKMRRKDETLFEMHVLETAGITLIILLLIFGVMYKYFLYQIPGFAEKYVIYIFYTIIIVVANATAIYHLKAYRNAVTCMTGMMIGMTIGMISGLTLGYLIGATNGMFVGSVYGVIVGVFTGIWCGRCCGIMGIMEGAMAGLMGGIMGAMTSVMMIFDHINLFTPFFAAICIGILAGLVYLVYKEHKDSDEKIIKPYSLIFFFAVCAIITIITIFIMIYAPNNGVLQ